MKFIGSLYCYTDLCEYCYASHQHETLEHLEKLFIYAKAVRDLDSIHYAYSNYETLMTHCQLEHRVIGNSMLLRTGNHMRNY